MGFTHVQNDRQATVDRDLQLRFEQVSLRLTVGLFDIEIETYFTTCYRLIFLYGIGERRQMFAAVTLQKYRVHAQRRIESLPGMTKANQPRPVGRINGRDNHLRDTGRPCTSDNGLPIGVENLQIKMAVGVDQLHYSIITGFRHTGKSNRIFNL